MWGRCSGSNSKWASEGGHAAAGTTAAEMPVPALVIASKQGQACRAGAAAGMVVEWGG